MSEVCELQIFMQKIRKKVDRPTFVLACKTSDVSAIWENLDGKVFLDD